MFDADQGNGVVSTVHYGLAALVCLVVGKLISKVLRGAVAPAAAQVLSRDHAAPRPLPRAAVSPHA